MERNTQRANAKRLLTISKLILSSLHMVFTRVHCSEAGDYRCDGNPRRSGFTGLH